MSAASVTAERARQLAEIRVALMRHEALAAHHALAVRDECAAIVQSHGEAERVAKTDKAGEALRANRRRLMLMLEAR